MPATVNGAARARRHALRGAGAIRDLRIFRLPPVQVPRRVAPLYELLRGSSPALPDAEAPIATAQPCRRRRFRPVPSTAPDAEPADLAIPAADQRCARPQHAARPAARRGRSGHQRAPPPRRGAPISWCARARSQPGRLCQSPAGRPRNSAAFAEAFSTAEARWRKRPPAEAIAGAAVARRSGLTTPGPITISSATRPRPPRRHC